MLYGLSAFRPHSSPDPLTRATLPPGEGIFTAPVGRRASEARPYDLQNCPPEFVGATLGRPVIWDHGPNDLAARRAGERFANSPNWPGDS